MSNRTYVVIGGGGSFGIHTAMYLLDHAKPAKVVGIGRNPLRDEVFSLGIDQRAGYEYRALHLTHELDLLLEYLDHVRPDVIINYAAKAKEPCHGSTHGDSSKPTRWLSPDSPKN